MSHPPLPSLTARSMGPAMDNSNYHLDIREPRPPSNYRVHANISFPDAGNGGSSGNDTSLSSGGQGGNVLFSNSNTNNVCESGFLHII
jgi:hypothetical protein